MPVRRNSSNDGGVKVSRKPRVAVGNSKGSGDGVRAPRFTDNDVGKGRRKERGFTEGPKWSSGVVRTPQSKDSDIGKGHRKERVATEGSKWSSGGVRTPRSEDSDVGKGHRKTRVAMEGSKGSSGGVRTLEAKKRGNRKVQSRRHGNDAVSYLNVNGKLSDTRGRRIRDSKMKSWSEGLEAVIDGKSGWKRKRISAEPGMVEHGMFDGNDKKSRSQSKKNVLNSCLDNGKKSPRKKDCELKDFSRNTLVTERGKFRGSEPLDKKVWTGKVKGADKPKHVGFRGSESLDKKVWTGKIKGADKPRHVGLGNGESKISDKRKAPSATQKEMNHRKTAVGSIEKPCYRKERGKKNFGTDSDLTEEPPKKKKRVIRIDPYDTSNKRLDDDLSNKGDNPVKIDKTESSDFEMSKNAQFRAIRPSSSILSFVEDNLLGRRRDIEFRRAGYNTELSAPLDNIPFSTVPERERTEVPAFRNKLEFFAAAKTSSSFPPPELPEIAFAGRSNVGKSSLLNAITRQWGVVRTSDKPGLTQSINFFKLEPKLCLVDLPGYGFAYAKEEVKEAWEELVKEYVTTRVGLKRVCLLIDTKWGMKPRDLELIDLMERSETKYQIVLTKTDMVFPIDVARRAMQIEENLKAKKSAVQPLMMVSSKTGAGIRSLRTVLANVARFVRR